MVDARQRCLDCLVRDTALCASMADDELVALSTIGRRRIFDSGQILSWSGDANMLCANVVSGALKVTASTPDGREQIVGLLFPGDFVGQPFAEETPLTIGVLTQSDLCIFPRDRFERTLGEHPKLERVLLQRTIASLNDARERMLTLGRRNAQERVAGFLLELADRMGVRDDKGHVHFDIPISRGETADFLGLTIETVSRQLTRLKAAGTIALPKAGRSIEVLDRAALEACASPD